MGGTVEIEAIYRGIGKGLLGQLEVFCVVHNYSLRKIIQFLIVKNYLNVNK
jgi:hypothetical protein